MVNRNNARRRAKRRRDQASSAVQNQSMPRKMVIILDDSWLEALKHLTCPQWSKMSLVCRQVNGIVQRNISRLPRQVIENIDLDPQYLSFNPHSTSIATSLQKLYHPASYIKEVTMHTVKQKLIDASCNGEKRYIRCQKFELLPYSDESSTPRKIAQSLDWLVRNVRSDSISFPEKMFNGIVNTVKIRAMLTNFVFGTSRKCKAQELVFSFENSYYNRNYDPRFSDFSNVELVDTLIEGYFALPVVQSTIPTVVIDRYPEQGLYLRAKHRKVISREVDSQGANLLYGIRKGEKLIRISLFRRYSYGPFEVTLKFCTI
ncbi:hypothetical protein Ddc_20829 [Ditylenchus destructor]|nr:hypothetical protein Ddc_20829 [Ditylenchus destructor]